MILELKHINKSFGAKRVLDDVSFEIESGKAFGLLGRNGAGKTTAIRILMNVFPCDSGSVLIDGEPIDYGKIKIGYLPEERGLYPKKVIFDQLIYFSELKGMSRKEAEKSVKRWLERLQMAEYASKKLETLSKGNQQKIQLITAVAHDPDIVVLDEPFSGLDPVNARLLKDVVKELISENKTVLFSSHQMSYIEEFCDSIAIIDRGRVALKGELDEIKRNYPRDRLHVTTLKPEAIMRDFGEKCETVGKNSVVIRLDSPQDKQGVMSRLSEGYDIDGVKVFEPTLNDIFVEYTAHKGE